MQTTFKILKRRQQTRGADTPIWLFNGRICFVTEVRCGQIHAFNVFTKKTGPKTDYFRGR